MSLYESIMSKKDKIAVVGLGYVGVDFVCDQTKGPLILEVNARPGLNIQIANQAGLRTRVR